MYVWNIQALKDEIKSGNFGDKEAIPYIVVTIFLYELGFELMSRWGVVENYNVWDSVNTVLTIVITVLGTIYAYRQNGGSHGKDFANKFFAISFVMGIRFLVYSIGLIAVLILYWSYAYSDDEEIPTTFVEVGVYAMWYLLLYYRIGKHIEDTVRSEETYSSI